MIEFLTALGIMTWGFVMGAAWQEWRHQNRRARANNQAVTRLSDRRHFR